jgi:hypothetical protein
MDQLEKFSQVWTFSPGGRSGGFGDLRGKSCARARGSGLESRNAGWTFRARRAN